MNIKDTKVQKGIVGIIVVIALVWLIFFTNYLPFSTGRTSQQVTELREELQVVAGELQRLESAVKSLPQIERELNVLVKRWDVLRGLLPRESEISSLLTNVTTAGMKSGVQFTLFEPGLPEPYDLYTKYPIRVSVTGGYHQVGRFFDNMCNMERLVGISDVGLRQLSDKEAAGTVEASATISAFAYRDQPDVPVGAEGSQANE
jgi:type IV pilus assembly protein PilO